jgi:hypothetical protein
MNGRSAREAITYFIFISSLKATRGECQVYAGSTQNTSSLSCLRDMQRTCARFIGTHMTSKGHMSGVT